MNLLKHKILIVASLALVFASGIAKAQVSEVHVQGREADGGSSTTIVGSSRAVRFSLTGRRGDIAGVILRWDRVPLFEASIQQIIEGRAWPLELDGPVVAMPDGQTRIFVRINYPDVWLFQWSTVRLRSGTVLLDADPVIFR